MKVTLLQTNNEVQLVLTPETEWETKALKAIPNESFKVMRGSFFEKCQGGWTREFQCDESLMLVCNKKDSK